MKYYSNDTLSLDELLNALKLHIGQADIILKLLAQRNATANAKELVRSYPNVWNLPAPFNYQPNTLTICRIDTIDVFNVKLIGIILNLDPPVNQHIGKIPLTKEMARDIANQLLIKVAEMEEQREHCGSSMRYEVVEDGDVFDGLQLTGTYYCEKCSTMQPTYQNIPQKTELDKLKELLRDLAPAIQHYFPITGLEIYNLKKRVDAAIKEEKLPPQEISHVCGLGHHNLCPIRNSCGCECHNEDVEGMVPR